MVQDTLRKQKKRKMLALEFDDNWENNYSTKQIVRKPRDWKRKAWELLIGKKFSVFAFYWWAKHDRLANEHARKFHFPVKHDNTPVPGLPIKYEMQGGWTFKESELKYLKSGPLVSEGHPEEILVGYDHGTSKFFRLCREVAPLVTILTATGTFGLRLLGIF